MEAVVVDIDDTLIDTDRRRHAAWSRVLGRDIPLQDVESKGSREIHREYGFSDRNVWRRFWMLTLCVEEAGADLLEFDKPIPYAPETLQKWREKYKLVYLTGRTENMRQLTLDELKKFGFPTSETDLEMFKLSDWMNYSASPSSVVRTRTMIFSRILRQHNVVRVVDDYPGFFVAYRTYPVQDKVGLLRKKRFSRRDYLANGATRIVENWKQLLDDEQVL